MSQERWDNIYNHIDRLDRRYKQNKNVGWVYIMRNPAFKDPILKIGKTGRPPGKRAAELGSSTSVPEDFQLIYFIHASNYHEAETLVHRRLAKYRKTRSKEFFNVPLGRAIEALDTVAKQYPIQVWQNRQMISLPQYFVHFVVTCSGCSTKNRIKPLLVQTILKCRNCGTPLERYE